MIIDRQLQKQLLEQLAAVYPEQTEVDSQRIKGDPVTLNLWYLEEHGLVVNTKSNTIGAPPIVIASRITHKGLDFLADDGGLTAILGTVTFKLHSDTLRELLMARLDSADIPEAEKDSIKDHLRLLPSEALNEATTRLINLGLDHVPDAIGWLQTLCGFGS